VGVHIYKEKYTFVPPSVPPKGSLMCISILTLCFY